MNRFYLIIPLLLLALFSGAYWHSARQADAQARLDTLQTDHALQLAAAQKADAVHQAETDAAQRAAARAEAEQQQAAKDQALWDAQSHQIATDTARYTAQADALTQQVDALQKQLDQLHATEQSTADATFALEKTIELSRIQKRTAELEVQRLTTILVSKIGVLITH